MCGNDKAVCETRWWNVTKSYNFIFTQFEMGVSLPIECPKRSISCFCHTDLLLHYSLAVFWYLPQNCFVSFKWPLSRRCFRQLLYFFVVLLVNLCVQRPWVLVYIQSFLYFRHFLFLVVLSCFLCSFLGRHQLCEALLDNRKYIHRSKNI